MDNSGYLNSSVSLFLFCCNEIVKINYYGARTLTAEPPPPYTSQYPCSWTTFPSKRRYFKDDPQSTKHFIINCQPLTRILFISNGPVVRIPRQLDKFNVSDLFRQFCSEIYTRANFTGFVRSWRVRMKIAIFNLVREYKGMSGKFFEGSVKFFKWLGNFLCM